MILTTKPLPFVTGLFSYVMTTQFRLIWLTYIFDEELPSIS